MTPAGPLLGVWAHPDDECYLSGGLMAATSDAGARVVCVTATRGEAGSTDEDRWPVADMARTREAELDRSLAILGVTEHQWLDLPDGGCADIDAAPQVERLVALMRDVAPAVVVTFGPDGITNHPDHCTIGKWTTDAFRQAELPGAQLWHPLYSAGWDRIWGDELRGLGVYPPGLPPVGERDSLVEVLDLDDDLLDRKYAALLAQESQVGGLVDALTPDRYRAFLREECFRLADPLDVR